MAVCLIHYRDLLLWPTRSSTIWFKPGKARWVEPRLIATVKHFGRTGGALRAGVLQALAVAD